MRRKPSPRYSWLVARRRIDGFSLLEVILASALFLVLTTAFLTLLTSTFTRTRNVDERQTVLERLIIFKEYCNQRLRNIRVETTESTADHLVFTAPVTASTVEGQLNTVGANEMTVWDELHRYHLFVKDEGGRYRAVEQSFSRDDPDDKDWVYEGERAVWVFESEGTLEFDLTKLPLASIKCSTVLRRRGGELPWQRELTLTMSNYR